MTDTSTQLNELLIAFKTERKALGITIEELEKKLVLGPGWLSSIESGEVSISLEMFFSLLSTSGISLQQISGNLQRHNRQAVPRNISSVKAGNDIEIHFRYAKHDARYLLRDAKVSEFNEVITVLRDELAKIVLTKNNVEAIKTEAVASAFKKAIDLWPDSNPSDIWWFLIYRAYCDPLNHPSIFSRLSFEQSWKRTGGWALEEILVRHYSPSLKKKGINLFIAPKDKREELLSQASVDHRLEADKADIFLTADHNGKEVFFGIVHVKASFAERRTDDVPMSKALVDGGYFSPLWTMDCKSSPSENPDNKGELGVVKTVRGKDKRSAKRKDIEDDGYFSACFSYNKNTNPTPDNQKSKSKIHICDFNNSESDLFHEKICEHWNGFKVL